MTNTRSHGSIDALFAAAGVQTFPKSLPVEPAAVYSDHLSSASLSASYSDDTVRDMSPEPESCPL